MKNKKKNYELIRSRKFKKTKERHAFRARILKKETKRRKQELRKQERNFHVIGKIQNLQ
jgi:hypothetical protein